MMKVALVHDYIKEYGGAERVLEALHEIYPDADVYTTVYLPSYLGPHRKRFEAWEIHTSFLQYIPGKAKLISPFRLLSPLAFQSFDFSKYDVIITSSTGAYFPNTLTKKKARLFCYCHTPPRYLYGYATAREWKNNLVLRIIGETINHFLRMVDFNSAQQVDQFIANSEEVKARIAKFYRKDAVVIYPPVELNSESKILNSDSKKSRSYFLTGGRLARAKHVDVIVKACTELKLPLKVFGKAFAGYGEELRALAGKTVEFVGEVTDEEKLELMAGARAFLFASEDEDFGITPVEAMGQGTPVIAFRSGGVKETVVENKTGLFFDQLTVESLIEQIKVFGRKSFRAEDCRQQAEKFSKKRFNSAIASLVAAK
ncbi:MAG TPA: glycosyltransferase [Patescibacteria group bacterium]|nr:glycosyltransferase [Patescibacteria group bacterium]